MTKTLARPLCLLVVAACSNVETGSEPVAKEKANASAREEPASAGGAEAIESSESSPQPFEDDDDATIAAPAACATTTSLESGHAYASVACPTQLSVIDHWSSAAAWAKLDSVPVTVAIVDGAFQTEHPDLAGAFAETYDFANPACKPFDASKSPCVDVAPPPSPPAEQLGSVNHGTIIAGVIAGRGKPGSGAVGVNPSAKLLGIGRDAGGDNLTALAWAIARKPDVISMSWPLGPAPGEKDVPAFAALLEEATAKGIVVVMAAGNTKTNVDAKAIYPTRYSSIPGVIAVGAVDDTGAFFDRFSNYGPGYVDIGAPGKVISSGGNYDGALYSVATGTSFSGPLVAGAAARVVQYLKSKNATYTAADVEKLLLDGSKADPALAAYFKDGRALDMTKLHAHLEATVK